MTSTECLFWKRWALISEALGAYFGSARRLFRKRTPCRAEERAVLMTGERSSPRRSVGFAIRQHGIWAFAMRKKESRDCKSLYSPRADYKSARTGVGNRRTLIPSPFCRICNPTAWNTSICNAIKRIAGLQIPIFPTCGFQIRTNGLILHLQFA